MNDNVAKKHQQTHNFFSGYESSTRKIGHLFVNDPCEHGANVTTSQTTFFSASDISQNNELSILASKSILNEQRVPTNQFSYQNLFFGSEESKCKNVNESFSFNSRKQYFEPEKESVNSCIRFCSKSYKQVDEHESLSDENKGIVDDISSKQKHNKFHFSNYTYQIKAQNKNESAESVSKNMTDKSVKFLSYKTGQEYFAERFYDEDEKEHKEVECIVEEDLPENDVQNDVSVVENKSFSFDSFFNKNTKKHESATKKKSKKSIVKTKFKQATNKKSKESKKNYTKKDTQALRKVNILLEYILKKSEAKNDDNSTAGNNAVSDNTLSVDEHVKEEYGNEHGSEEHGNNAYTNYSLGRTFSDSYPNDSILPGNSKNLINFYNDFYGKKSQKESFNFGFDKFIRNREEKKSSASQEESNENKSYFLSEKLSKMCISDKNNSDCDQSNVSRSNTEKNTAGSAASNIECNAQDNALLNHTESNTSACIDLSCKSQCNNITNAELSKLLPGKNVYFGKQKIKEYGGDIYAFVKDFEFKEYTEKEMERSEHLCNELKEIDKEMRKMNITEQSRNKANKCESRHNTLHASANAIPNKVIIDTTLDSYYKKDFTINIYNLYDRRTTVMLKNIPNKYTQKMILDLLNEHHSKTYNFVYLKMDLKNKCNIGYAFINFISYKVIKSFFIKVDGKSWKKLKSCKIARVNYASIQGFENLVRKFEFGLENENEEFKPFVLKEKW